MKRTKILSIKHRHMLDTPKRRRILPPYKTLKESGLQKGDIMADIGCGIGYFSIPAAKIVGNSGKIIAIDPSEKMLDDLMKRIKKEKIMNIEVKKSLAYQFPIQDAFVTFALLSNVFHEIDDKSKFLKEVYRIVKTKGRFCIVDYEKKDTVTGPPVEDRLSVREVKIYLKETGFSFIKSITISSTFIMYLANKN